MKIELLCEVPQDSVVTPQGNSWEEAPVTILFVPPRPLPPPPSAYLSPLFHIEMSFNLHLPVSFAF